MSESTSSVLWPTYVLHREDGGRTVVIDVTDLGEWQIDDVIVDEERRERLMINLSPGHVERVGR